MKKKPSEYLMKYFNRNYSLEQQQFIDQYAKIIVFEKGTDIIRMGEEVDAFYFMIDGIVRGYYLDDEGNEITKCFSYENCFFGSECYRTKKEATYFVGCIEDCKCIKLPYSLIKELALLEPQIEKDIYDLYLKEVEMLEKRTKDLLLLSAEERYLLFCRNYPNLEHRVPLKMISSFIGIQAGSMSRIRKKIKKNRN